jgi:hypothetical protein
VKYLILADIHYANHRVLGGPFDEDGINERARRIDESFRSALETAHDIGVDHLIVAGDIFDSCNASPQLVALVQRSLTNPLTEKRRVPILIPGNHDRGRGTGEDHALAPLRPLAYVATKPGSHQVNIDGECCLVPYTAGQTGESVLQAFREHGAKAALWVGHCGISDESTAPWLREGDRHLPVRAVFEAMKETKAIVAVFGDWHEHREWTEVHEGRTLHVVQCGAFVPTGFDNPSTIENLDDLCDPYGSILLLEIDGSEEDGWTLKHSPNLQCFPISGPRFVKVTSIEEALEAKKAAEVGAPHHLYLRYMQPFETYSAENTRALQEAVGPDVRVDSQPLAAKSLQRAAVAQEVQRTKSLDQALSTYVSSTEYQGSPDKEKVLQAARDLVKGAAP